MLPLSFIASINKDVQDARKLWGDSSLFMKIVIGASIFLTTGSITSLSDVVFEWKGFILDGIEAYRALVVTPLREFAREYNLVYRARTIDVLMIYGVFLASMVRLILSDKPREPEHQRIWRLSVRIIGVLGTALYGTLVWYAEGKNLSANEIWNLVALFVLLTWCASYIGFSYTKLWNTELFLTDKATRRKRRIASFAPIIIAFSITLILGAINMGLTRTR